MNVLIMQGIPACAARAAGEDGKDAGLANGNATRQGRIGAAPAFAGGWAAGRPVARQSPTVSPCSWGDAARERLP